MHNAVIVVFSRAVIQTKRSDSTNKSDDGLNSSWGPSKGDVRTDRGGVTNFHIVLRNIERFMTRASKNQVIVDVLYGRPTMPAPSSQRTAPEEVTRRRVLNDCQEVRRQRRDTPIHLHRNVLSRISRGGAKCDFLLTTIQYLPVSQRYCQSKSAAISKFSILLFSVNLHV